MIRFSFQVFFMMLLAFGSVNLISCSNADSQEGSPDIPKNIRTAADKVIISRTGEAYFKEYITPDTEETKVIPQGFYMSYRFYIPQKPFIDERITFVLDSAGVIKTDMEIVGIPECADFPDNCLFIIDEEGARKIAKEAGLQEGIKDWGTQFMWNAELGKYVWHVVSTLEGREGPDGFRGKGKDMTIDPNSGEILKENEWNIR